MYNCTLCGLVMGMSIITPRTHARARGYVIGRGVYYILTYLHATNTCNFTGHLQQGGCSKVWGQCQIGIAAQLWEVHYLPPGGQQDMASPLLLRPQSWGQLFPVLADPGSESTTALQWGVTHFALSRLWQNLSCVHGTAVETCSFV